jgi:septum formation protein
MIYRRRKKRNPALSKHKKQDYLMSVFTSYIPFVLASGSPRRFDLLAQQGLDFTVCKTPPDFVEDDPDRGEKGEDYALRTASAKARAVFNRLSASSKVPFFDPVLAADTIVCLDDNIFGKPSGPEHALSMLRLLAGRTHEVITACCLLLPQLQQEDSFALTSRVTFWDCPEKALLAYAHSAEPLDKAGAYAVQGTGSFLIRSIQGSWSNVVGLPISEVLEKLLHYKIIGVTNDHS